MEFKVTVNPEEIKSFIEESVQAYMKNLARETVENVYKSIMEKKVESFNVEDMLLNTCRKEIIYVINGHLSTESEKSIRDQINEKLNDKLIELGDDLLSKTKLDKRIDMLTKAIIKNKIIKFSEEES